MDMGTAYCEDPVPYSPDTTSCRISVEDHCANSDYLYATLLSAASSVMVKIGTTEIPFHSGVTGTIVWVSNVETDSRHREYPGHFHVY